MAVGQDAIPARLRGRGWAAVAGRRAVAAGLAGAADGPYRLACTLFGISATLWLVVHFLGHPQMLDLLVYRDEGRAVRHGMDLYGAIGAPYGLRATYPPFAALCFTVLTVIPVWVCFAVAGVANLLLLLAAVALSRVAARRAGGHVDTLLVPVVAAVAVWSEPVFMTLHYGQVNLLTMVLVLVDAVLPASHRWRGVAVGVATAIKLTPGIMIVYLLLTRRIRAAGRACATAAAAVLLALAVLPGETLRYFSSLMLQTNRVGNVANPVNQSVRGVLVRAMGRLSVPIAGTVLIALVGAAGLGCAVACYRRRGEAWGVCAAAVTGLLVSPISWSHHWVWCVPITVLLLGESWSGTASARAMLAVTVAVFGSYLVWQYPSDQAANLRMSWAAQLTALPYVVFGLVFLCYAVASRRPPRSPRGFSAWPPGIPRWRADAASHAPGDRPTRRAG